VAKHGDWEPWVYGKKDSLQLANYTGSAWSDWRRHKLDTAKSVCALLGWE